MRTVSLSGLHGTSGQVLEAVMFERAESAKGLLRHHRAVSAAGDVGAINVWRDNEGRFRCERMFYMRVQAYTTVRTLDDVVEWLRVHLPLIRKRAA